MNCCSHNARTRPQKRSFSVVLQIDPLNDRLVELLLPPSRSTSEKDTPIPAEASQYSLSRVRIETPGLMIVEWSLELS